MGIQLLFLTLIHELFDFRDFRAGRDQSVVDCKNIPDSPPFLVFLSLAMDLAAAPIKTWNLSPNPLCLGWPCKVLGQRNVMEVTVCQL